MLPFAGREGLAQESNPQMIYGNRAKARLLLWNWGSSLDEIIFDVLTVFFSKILDLGSQNKRYYFTKII